MLILPQTWRLCSRPRSLQPNHFTPFLLLHRRHLLTLAIETSCDDTAVAILSKHDASSEEGPDCAPPTPQATVHFHQKHTADNSKFRGIHPINALISHQEKLASLITTALPFLPPSNKLDTSHKSISIRCLKTGEWIWKRKPDFISVTRGPGIRSSLSTGLDTAKGLALAWQIPLLGVNHMQAHALTSRLVSALEMKNFHSPLSPDFPFLSLLVSGGHTLLVHSKSIIDHAILATTCDIAIGNAIDKIARAVCPESLLQSPGETMYGRLLEEFAFPNGLADHDYIPPATRVEEITRRMRRWGWSLPIPFAETRSGSKTRTMEFTFTGLGSTVERICSDEKNMGHEERVELAREAMKVAFEHLASRVVLGLGSLRSSGTEEINTLVVSGGVAANGYLQTILRAFLDAKSYPHINLSFPPRELCTDNAAMIAWAGIEMYEGGWESKFSCRALRKWSLDAQAEDGGILRVEGWRKRITG